MKFPNHSYSQNFIMLLDVMLRSQALELWLVADVPALIFFFFK